MTTDNIAFITQTYRADLDECCLLCESLDRFAPEVEHYIFVNDEDLLLFKHLEGGRRHVLPKSVILPKWLVRCPVKMLGHHYHVSPFTIPVREWIIQQICKLGVFEVLPSRIEAVFNFDSEVVMMKPFDLSRILVDGRLPLFRTIRPDEPSQQDYVNAARRLLRLSPEETAAISDLCFMSVPVCFERENTRELLSRIASNSIFRSWKLALCNTYRFSEYYTYGIFTTLRLDCRHHYLIDYHPYPVVDISRFRTPIEFIDTITPLLSDPRNEGLWLQKCDRRHLHGTYLPSYDIATVIRELWNS